MGGTSFFGAAKSLTRAEHLKIHKLLARQASSFARNLSTRPPQNGSSLESGGISKLLFLNRAGILLNRSEWTKQSQRLFCKVDPLWSSGASAQNRSFIQGALSLIWAQEQIAPGSPSPLIEILRHPRRHRGAGYPRQLEAWQPGWSYDPLYGWVGIGMFGLTRKPGPLKNRLVQDTITLLDEAKENGPLGQFWRVSELTWQFNQEERELEQYPRDLVSLGTAHGLSGVIGFLSFASAAGAKPNRCAVMISGAVDFLVRLERISGGEPYPEQVDSRGRLRFYRGGAWCGGDMSVGYALSTAALTLGDGKLKRLAEKIFVRGCELHHRNMRRLDISLCHGLAGAAFMNLRMYQRTAIPRFKNYALDFYRELMNRLSDSRKPPFRSSYLLGIPGAALSLLALIDTDEPVWDAPLILASPKITET